jgi:hypothetical protein
MGDFYRNLLRSNVAFGAKGAEPQEQAGAEASPPAAQQAGEGLQRQSQPGDAQREMEKALAREASAQRGAASPPPAAAEQRQLEQPPRAKHGMAAAPGADAAPAAEAVPAAGGTDEGPPPAAEEQPPTQQAGQRRNAQDAVSAALERYLARKRQKLGAV